MSDIQRSHILARVPAAFGCLTTFSAGPLLILFAIGAFVGSDSAAYAVTGRLRRLRA